MVQLSMPVATQMLLQVAERNIGQLTDIETDVYTGLASPGKQQVSSDATNIGAGSGRATLAAARYRDASGGGIGCFKPRSPRPITGLLTSSQFLLGHQLTQFPQR
jgi:hypothetical protein